MPAISRLLIADSDCFPFPQSHTRQKQVQKKPHTHARGESCTGHSDDESEDEELNDDDSRLFVWNQCSTVILSILEEDTARCVSDLRTRVVRVAFEFFLPGGIESDHDCPRICELTFVSFRFELKSEICVFCFLTRQTADCQS